MSSESKTVIVLTGATGYIGGSILQRFLSRPDISTLDIRVIIRSHEKAAKLQTASFNGVTVTPIVGSHDDAELMERVCGEADVVIAAADCDNLDAAKFTLRGLKKRFEATGKKPILIHTSGTGVYVDWAEGKLATENFYNDTDADKINSLPNDAPHRPIDLEVISGDTAGYVDTYIILPPTVWGLAKGPLFDQGISHNASIQVPVVIKAALDRGQGGMMNEGKNYWPLVEISELADLYSILFDAARSDNPKAGHGRNGYYNAIHGEFTAYELAVTISKVLVELGKGTSTEAKSFTQEELTKYFGPWAPFFGTNSRGLADHSKSLGWAPVKGKAEFLASIKPETEAIIAQGGGYGVGR